MFQPRFLAPSLLTLALAACGRAAPAPPPASSTASSPAATGEPAAASAPAAAGPAVVGKAAPDFTLTDLDGKSVALASLRGKTVVLEWFNPGCPFVKASHTKGSLRDAAATHTARGITWLAINSGAPGRQGHGVEANREAVTRYSLKHPVLLDPDGKVGRAYGASNTPHMFVIDPAGTLVYAGAVDNSPDGEGESPTDGKLVKHVDVALADLAAGRPVSVAQTKAYGCSVKY